MNFKHEHEHEHDHCCDHEHEDEHQGCSCCSTEFDDIRGIRNKQVQQADYLYGIAGFRARYKKDLIVLSIGVILFIASLILEHTIDLWPVTLMVCIAAYLILGHSVLKNAVSNLGHGNIFDENFLMSIATLAAFAIGDFPEAVGVMMFYQIGELFEGISVERSRETIAKAVDMRPETVNLISYDGENHRKRDQIRVIPAGDAKVGDILQINPGERIPLDGVVVSGSGQIDTSPVTGEPVPVVVKKGDDIISGCINRRGQMQICVTAQLEESMVSRILNSVEKAAGTKPEIEKFITKFARIYTPIVVVLAVLVAIVPPLIQLAGGGSMSGVWYQWILTAVTFLVISCPCAMVISVPLAFFLGIGAASRKGILFKSGLAVEGLRKIKIIALDKTGTITHGIVEDSGLLEIEDSDDSAKTSESFEEAFAKKKVSEDEPKADAAGGIAGIKSLGLKAAMLTGDRHERAQAIATEVGLDDNFIRSQLLPDEKLDTLQKLREEHGEIMFVGDGINDAPVLAGADVGAAMGAGADAAIEAADVVFMNSNVGAIPEAIAIARRTGMIAKQNIVLALAIKVLVLILGFAGLANIWFAIFADTGVCMLCIFNSLKLLK